MSLPSALACLLPRRFWTSRRLGLLAKPPQAEKFFYETSASNHYDQRYFKKELQVPVIHRCQRGLLREFCSICGSNNLTFFLMHGSLLGWYWGRRILPWDSDIDISIDFITLKKLASLQNSYLNPRYRLEVNPNWRERQTCNNSHREHQENNKIDARLIDTDNGLFLDITALSETKSGILASKCPHFFRHGDIYPLQREQFEDLPVWIPAGVKKLLIQEYGKRCLHDLVFNGFAWNPVGQCWQGQNLQHACQQIIDANGRSKPRQDYMVIGRYRRTVACHYTRKRLIHIEDDRLTPIPFGEKPGELCSYVLFHLLQDSNSNRVWAKLYQTPDGSEQLIHECLLYNALAKTDFPVVFPIAYDDRYGMLFPFDAQLFSSQAIHFYHCREYFSDTDLLKIKAFANYQIVHPIVGKATISEICDFQTVQTDSGLRFIDFTLWPEIWQSLP